MKENDWETLTDDIEREVEFKNRDYRKLTPEEVEEATAYVIMNAFEKFSSGTITNWQRLQQHALNHVINAIRKVSRYHLRNKNHRYFYEQAEQALSKYDQGLSIEVITLEGIPHISDQELEIARKLSMGFSQSDLLKEKIVCSRRQLRKAIKKIKRFLL
jgi:uncharacterized protein (DUF433 family)